MNDQQGQPGDPTPRQVGRELTPRPGERPAAGPGRFATPQYTGDQAEYGTAPRTGPLPLDQPYDRSQYGHYEVGDRYTPAHRDRSQLLELPDGISYASWGERCAAWLIDMLAFVGCTLPVTFGTAWLISTTESAGEPRSPGATALIGAVYFLGWLGWMYQITWRQGSRGQSWGKQVMGIHLVNADTLQPPGGAIGIARYVLRGAFSGLTCFIYLFVTAVWPLSDIRMQTLDDKLANTVVVRLPPERAVF